ncbi:MAG: riboflavin synthase [Phycisphaerales bacterium]
MFTGLIQHRGTVAAVEEVDFGRRLVLDASGWSHRPDHGESIAVNGCCLTVNSDEGRLSFDVIAQTLRLTTLGDLSVGAGVNLEACVTPSTLLGGHLVQGHVDGVGRIAEVRRGSEEVVMRIEPPSGLLDYFPPRGSVAVDGVSLTLAEVDDRSFSVALIPTTLEETTLGEAQVGDRVNLEADMLVKAVAHVIRRMGLADDRRSD